MFWNQVDLSSAGWLTVSLLLSLRGCWESSGGNPPRTTRICVSVRCELFSTKGTSHWHTPGVPLLSLRVCARLSGSVHRVGNCTVDGWWCVLTRSYAFGLLPLLCTSQIGDCQSANCFTLQMARSGGLNRDTVRKQRRSLLSPWAWSLAQGHRSTRSPVSFFSFMVAMKKQNNDEWNKRVFQSWKGAQMDWLRV